jgi:phosphatidylinositol glycan class H protein
MPARLSISQPSPATVLFSISNAPTRDTLTAKLIFYLEALLRILICLFVLLIDLAKLHGLGYFRNGAATWDRVGASSIGALAFRVAEGHRWQVVAACSGLVIYLAFRKGYTGASGFFIMDYE